MCNPFDPGSLIGGNKSSSKQSTAQTATNTTEASNSVSVSVQVPITTDTTPLAAAIDALRGSQDSTAAALVGALQSNAQTLAASTTANTGALAGALASNAKTVAAAVQSAQGDSRDVQIFIGILGLIGALIAAHVLRLPDIDL